jgi:hypothetical protein
MLINAPFDAQALCNGAQEFQFACIWPRIQQMARPAGAIRLLELNWKRGDLATRTARFSKPVIWTMRLTHKDAFDSVCDAHLAFAEFGASMDVSYQCNIQRRPMRPAE